MRRLSGWSGLIGAAALLAVGLTGCGREPEAVEAAAAPGPVLAVAVVDSHAIHRARAGTICNDCHSSHGGMMGSALIDLSTRAIPGQPAPSFNTTTKTCSNVDCHTIPTGTYSYWFPDGTGEAALVTVGYGGLGITTPAWNSTDTTCDTCHGNPPRDGRAWHSGTHANAGPTGAANQCQFCHPDAVSTSGVATGLSTATNCGPTGTTPCASLHRNGVVEVAARFRSSCFGCH